MAVCRDCDQEMLAGVGCTAFPGRRPVEGGKCHDCSAPVGGLHHPGCDMERCDHGGQAIFCDRCNDAKADTGLDYWQRMAAVDRGGPVSSAGVMPPGSAGLGFRLTNEQRAAYGSAQAVIQRLAADQVQAQMNLHEGLIRGYLVERVRAEIERCDDESVDFTVTAAAVVDLLLEVLRNPPTVVTDAEGVTRVVPPEK